MAHRKVGHFSYLTKKVWETLIKHGKKVQKKMQSKRQRKVQKTWQKSMGKKVGIPGICKEVYKCPNSDPML